MANIALVVAAINYEMIFCNPFDLQKVCFAAACINAYLVVVGSLIHIWRNKKELWELSESFGEFYPKALDPIAEHFYWRVKVIQKLMVAACGIITIGIGLIPLFVYLFTGDVVMPLPFPRSLFDPTKNVLLYAIVYLAQVACTFQATVIMYSHYAMKFSIVSCLALEFRSLGRDFREQF
jgi:hypothetical protein